MNRINDEKLSEITNQQFTLEAINRSQAKKIVNPLTDATGAIRNTPLQKVMKLKVSAKVVLTYNIDTIECACCLQILTFLTDPYLELVRRKTTNDHFGAQGGRGE